ncbi:unnamed protein product, partial [marine sediment metagenome]
MSPTNLWGFPRVAEISSRKVVILPYFACHAYAAFFLNR